MKKVIPIILIVVAILVISGCTQGNKQLTASHVGQEGSECEIDEDCKEDLVCGYRDGECKKPTYERSEEIGGRCISYEDCKSNYCPVSTKNCGMFGCKCQESGDLGDSCESRPYEGVLTSGRFRDDNCRYDLTCIDGVCKRPGSAGDTCEYDNDCLGFSQLTCCSEEFAAAGLCTTGKANTCSYISGY